jgi:hypothetical protein
MTLHMDGFFDEHNLEWLRAADTLVLGAKLGRGGVGVLPYCEAQLTGDHLQALTLATRSMHPSCSMMASRSQFSRKSAIRPASTR